MMVRGMEVEGGRKRVGGKRRERGEEIGTKLGTEVETKIWGQGEIWTLLGREEEAEILSLMIDVGMVIIGPEREEQKVRKCS